MKFRVKADKNSSLYFIEYHGGSYPQFIINDSPGWESIAKTFDTWQDANEVAKHFSGYIEEVQPEVFYVYWNGNIKEFITVQKNKYFRFDNIIENDLTEQGARELAKNLNISYEFAMRNDKNG